MRRDPLALAASVRSAVGALDPEMPLFDVRSMRTHLRQGKGSILLQLASGLVGVGPTDPVVFATGATMLAAVGFVAVWLPARRATRVDPVEVLRSE